MRHPDWDYYTVDFIGEVMNAIAVKTNQVIDILDKIINFFNHTYVTAAEGMECFPMEILGTFSLCP